MPFIPHTPESLIPRSDSKNPTATCRGLTSSGRLCRRAIATVTPLAKTRLSSQSSLGELPADAYCWQHKDQATPAQGHTSPQGLQNSTIRERTSVDTLVDRLGLLEIVPEKGAAKQRRRPVPPRPITYAGGTRYTEKQEHYSSAKKTRKPQNQGNLVLFCCVGVADEDHVASRPAPIPHHKSPGSASRPTTFQSMNQSTRGLQPPKQSRPSRNSAGSRQNPIIIDPQRPPLPRDPSSQTQQLLSLIPKTASPQTTSLLLTELSKPPSTVDDEGYIYIFWLTPESLPQTPPSEAASSLLEVPCRPQAGKRRTSDVLQSFSSSAGDRSSPKTILLKIGRASNVQRRLNEWSRQCGYNLSLIRYYPYQPSSPRSPPSASPDSGPTTPRKVPHAHKVERLIHVELGGLRAQGSGKCASCGREHREWFEVEATREGVRSVDEVVRRWVDWGVRGGAAHGV